ncbi:MAG: SGNH/GDSL hydrolase family protein [Candidatus Melainabacteria bacterium]|nr:SGNH/GDSL hydrolase family protein [Candidatus Melainabacteria bacterium]
MKNSFKLITIKNIIGVVFIVLGMLFNKNFLELFFSPYAVIELNSKLPVWVVSLIFILIGIAVLFLKKERFSLNKIISVYKYAAITLFSTTCLFLLLNLVIHFSFLLKDVLAYRSQIFLAYRQPIEPLYLDLNKKQINKLLYETWSRPYIYEPYTQFKERPFMGEYINVSDAGYRYVKNQGHWPPSPDNLNIFFFGGSTVFGYGVQDKDSIASKLQDLIASYKGNKKNVFVYNFGRGNYFSSQERILFEKLLTEGIVPDIAIFMDGLNDFYYGGDEPLFTEKFKLFVAGKGNSLFNMPLFRLIENMKNRNKQEVKFHRQEILEKEYNDIELINSAVGRYVKNKKAIETIGHAFGIKSFFIWQPVPTYKYDLKYHIFAGKGFGRFMYSKYGYAYMEEFVKSHDMGDNFLWLADMQENMKKPLYIDIDHYSPEMSKEVAIRIANFLKSRI